MLFNSLEFLYFLPIVFVLYWFVFNRSFRLQNAMLLVASYFFYAFWDYRFLFLLIFSTLLDYYTGLKMSETQNPGRRRFWFWLSVFINLGFLGVFKYYNFFASSLVEALSTVGLDADVWTLQVILPVGISFYTFHGLSYVIDIYNRRIQPERNFIDYAVFVCYFPLLVAGPIERATHLLPQVKKPRTFRFAQAIHGVELILWGFFKKVVIADSLAGTVNTVFSDSGNFGSTSLILGALAFSFQIYGDFSGYSDIAIGTSKLFGIELFNNFNFPYASRNIAEFWRRWHISLSSWFRDYLYIPLGGSRVSRWLSVRNVMIVFLVSGIWHGANWTFVVWGCIHGLLFVPSFVSRSSKSYPDDIITETRPYPKFIDIVKAVTTFALVTLAWVFFRAPSLSEAKLYLVRIFTNASGKQLMLHNSDILTLGFSFLAFFILSAFYLYRKNNVLRLRTGVQFAVSVLLLVLISLFGEFNEQSFIYFQF
jgi:alginate O-acetyltransferase complex protein AlgI